MGPKLMAYAGWLVLSATALGSDRHGGVEGDVIETSAAHSSGVASSGGSISLDFSGFPGDGAANDPARSKKKGSPIPADDTPATTLSFVLYTKANAVEGRQIAEGLRQRETLVVAVSPLDTKNFSAGVEKARKQFLDHWWPYPQTVRVTVVSPEQPANGYLLTDDEAWPLATLADREMEMKERFNGRLPAPEWYLGMPVPEGRRCTLPIQVAAGLNEKFPAKRRPERWASFLDPLQLPYTFGDGKRKAFDDKTFREIYRCGTDPITPPDLTALNPLPDLR